MRPTELTRRSFLKGAGSALALSLVQLGWSKNPVGPRTAAAATGTTAAATTGTVEYTGYQDVFRQQWTWDRVARGTHFVNCWYQRGCNWNVYVKDGLVVREEQAAIYEQTNAEVADYNPRGCQKGACYSERMYDASRLQHPLKRVGKRGEGRWKRITWEEALEEIADNIIDAMVADGSGSVIWDEGTGVSNGCIALGLYRTVHALGTPMIDLNAEIGDHHPGAAVTAGKMVFTSSADDLYYSDLIINWGGNPVYTQIPQAHFIYGARYNGARLVSITPDYNASSIHTDSWIPVNVGTDAALGLSLARVMIEEGIYDEKFVAEQTDLALLVRIDTRHLLRASDLERGGDDDVFYFFDKNGGITKAPRRNLGLGSAEPALEGEYKVETKDGEVTVVPSFALLRESLAAYTPEKAAEITGTAPDLIRSLARDIAGARAASIITQSNFSKFYHGIAMERAQILVMALAGQIGRKGAGFNAFPYLSLAGVDTLAVATGLLPPSLGQKAVILKMMPAALSMKLKGYTDEMITHELARGGYRKGTYPASELFLYYHGGLDEYYGSSKDWDPHMKRELSDYLSESVERGWQLGPGTRPRVLMEAGGNMLRRIRGYPKMMTGLLPELDLLATFDWRMSFTAMHSDIVLPCAGWYEKDDITWATALVPFAHVTTRAVEPLAESKSDWEIHCLIVKTIQERAIARGIGTFKDLEGEDRRFDKVYEEMTFGRRYTEENTEEFLEEICRLTTNMGGIGWQELKERGYKRFTGLGSSYLNPGNATDIEPHQTITANTWHTEKKRPWPTLTRRLQFYIDHDFYMELGEELPVHKDPPPIGGDYPLILTSGHTRWSIHTSWREQKDLLYLQRGEPAVFVSPVDAAARGIDDGDYVRAYNDIGSFEAQAKLSPTLRPGQVVIYHAWEPHQFRGHRSQQALTPNPINPLQIAGGHFHLQPRNAIGQPGASDRGTRVEVERVV